MQTNNSGRTEFLQVLETHQGILHRVCSVYGRGKEDQQDLFQEMVLQLWRSYPTFRDQSRVTTWMYRVALNTALLARRKATRRRIEFRGGDIELPDPSAEAPTSDDEVLLLRVCIQELPTLDRAIVLLHLEDRSYDEIAEITGLSRSNVSVRLVRLKERLRLALEQKGLGKDTLR